MTLQRSREAEAFISAIRGVPSDAVSACSGWTAHEVAAHMAAGAAEVIRHLEPHLQGYQVPQTRGFEEREAPYRQCEPAHLCDCLDQNERVMRELITSVLDSDPEAVIPWTGRHMAVAKFVPHMRNEFAIHRWDIAGDDATSMDLLSQAELTEHAVQVLGKMLLAKGSQRLSGKEDLVARLRTRGTADVRLEVASGQAALNITDDQADEPYIEMDAAARTLFLWGRRPSPPARIRSHLPVKDLEVVQSLLAGY